MKNNISIGEISIKTILQDLRQIFIIYDFEENGCPGKILSINPFTIEKLGYLADEIKEFTLKDLFSDNIYEQIFEELKNKEEFVNRHCTFINKEGIFLDVLLTKKIVESNGRNRGILMGDDVSQIYKLEEEIRFLGDEVVNQKENYEALIDNLTQTQDQLLQTEKMAALGQLIAGVAHEINSPLGAIKASNANINNSLKNAIEEFPRLFSEYSKEEQEAFLIIFDIAKKPVPQISSREKRAIKKQIKLRLDELNVANSAIVADKFIYLGIYNDLEKIMQYVSQENFLRVLDSVRDFVSILKNTSTISIAVEKAAKVTFALKKFAHQDQTGEKTPTDIIDGVETVLTLYNNQIKHGIKIIRNYEDIPMVTCNADEINQVWTNLIQNALHAMGQNGTLTITAKKENSDVIISMSDTGYGIEPDIKEKIFQPFFTTKKIGEGSGLGLDIVKKIVEKHEGIIYFNSELNVGTTFYVKLPINQSE